MHVRLIKHFSQSVIHDRQMVSRDGYLPFAPFLGLEIEVRDVRHEEVPTFVVQRVIVELDEGKVPTLIVEPLEPELEQLSTAKKLAEKIQYYVDGGWQYSTMLGNPLGIEAPQNLGMPT